MKMAANCCETNSRISSSFSAPASDLVERAERLVEKEERRLRRQRPRDRRAHPHPARERLRIVVLEPLEADEPDRVVCAGALALGCGAARRARRAARRSSARSATAAASRPGRRSRCSRRCGRPRPRFAGPSPEAIRSRVDFPQPDGPTTARNSPRLSVNETSRTASVPSGKILPALRNSMTSDGVAAAVTATAPSRASGASALIGMSSSRCSCRRGAALLPVEVHPGDHDLAHARDVAARGEPGRARRRGP